MPTWLLFLIAPALIFVAGTVFGVWLERADRRLRGNYIPATTDMTHAGPPPKPRKR